MISEGNLGVEISKGGGVVWCGKIQGVEGDYTEQGSREVYLGLVGTKGWADWGIMGVEYMSG